jgi:hypothetical protein
LSPNSSLLFISRRAPLAFAYLSSPTAMFSHHASIPTPIRYPHLALRAPCIPPFFASTDPRRAGYLAAILPRTSAACFPSSVTRNSHLRSSTTISLPPRASLASTALFPRRVGRRRRMPVLPTIIP